MHAVRQVAAGEPMLSPRITRRLMDRAATEAGAHQRARAALARLSPRENEVVLAIARGRSNADIAAELYMSVATVKAHVSSVLTKLDLDNRTQIALLAHDTASPDARRNTGPDQDAEAAAASPTSPVRRDGGGRTAHEAHARAARPPPGRSGCTRSWEGHASPDWHRDHDRVHLARRGTRAPVRAAAQAAAAARSAAASPIGSPVMNARWYRGATAARTTSAGSV